MSTATGIDRIEDIYELSPLQQGMLFHTLRSPESGMYLEQICFPLEGVWNAEPMESSWRRLMARHPILRTAIVWEGIEKPIQIVYRDGPTPIAQLDWQQLPSSVQQSRIEEFLAEDRRKGFAPGDVPLFRLTLIRTSPAAYWFVLTFHHVLLDGWSLQRLSTEFSTLYAAACAALQVTLPPVRPYADYIAWLQAQDADKARQYWTSRMAGYTTPAPFPRSTPGAGQDCYDEYHYELSGEVSSRLRAFAQEHKLTLNTLIQGAWAMLLSRYTASDDVVFGSVVSGRPAAMPGAEAILGLFINTIPVRAQVDPQVPVATWLASFQANEFSSREFDYTSLVDIHGWSGLPRSTPLFDTVLALENYPINAPASGGKSSGMRHFQRTNYPLTVAVLPQDRLQIILLYDGSFDRAVMERLARHLERLLTAMTVDAGAPVGDLPMLTPEEQRQIVIEWNKTGTDYPKTASVPELFEQQAAASPEAIAGIFANARYTYSDLNARANQLAHTLLDRGFGKGSTVGICVERSIDALVGLLGILKTGAAYLPIDPMYPAERIHFMLRDARAGCLLTQQHLAANHDTLQLPTLCLDSVWPSIRTASRDNPGPQAGPDDVAYVMYTSGSTGEPKGTLIPHRAIVRLVRNTNYIEIRPDDRIAHVSNFSFDAATFEIWGALLNGATVVGIDRDIALSPSPFAEELRTNRITALFLTTSLFNQIIAAVPDAFATLRHLLFGGSAVDPRPVRECLRRGAPARLLHVYGPTENTTFSTWFHIHDVPQDATTIPIGNAISNTTIYVLDSRRRVVSVGVTGELYTGGDGLALGYLRRPELTEEKFVPHPFEPGQRLYRTGDLVRRQHDGSIVFLSRVDDQVKIRGFRAEPGEVETALRSMAEIRDAVVVARPDDTGSKRLLAYVTPANGHLSSDELRARLRLKLPDYMIPSAFIEIDSVPLTANGKPDYRKLPEPHEQRPSLATQFAAPATPLEAAVAAIWKDVLHLDKVGNRDNFFDLGGHSLLATQLISRLREDFEVELPFARFFENPTVAGVASAIEALQWLKTGAAARREQAGEAFEEGVL